MALPSQFSVEEENFYKDIQDLVKNGSRNEKELSSFLQCYMNLLSRDDDETFIINFTKAGLIIEASAKVYGNKVDKLWLNLEHILESLRSKSQAQSKKKTDCEDIEEVDLEGSCEYEEGKRKLPPSRRRKKLGEALFSVDDFLEIDNITGLLGKNMNENSKRSENKLKLCGKVPNMFIKNKTKKKKIDVCLNKCTEDKDTIRLRDWVLTECGLLVKEIYTSLPESANIMGVDEEMRDESRNEEEVECELSGMLERVDFELTVVGTEGSKVEETERSTESLKNEKNNNSEVVVKLRKSSKEKVMVERVIAAEEEEDAMDDAMGDVMGDLNVSRESDVAKFPNVLDRRRSGDCLVDVDEVFWNASKFQDVMPSKKMRTGKTNKPPCQLCCVKKVHKKRGKRCVEGRSMGSLDSYFNPYVQPAVPEPQFGILPDDDLQSIFKVEMKLIEQLGKVNTNKNINEAYNRDESPEELMNFLGFDAFENRLMKKTTTEIQEEEMLEVNLRDDPGEDDNLDNCLEEVCPDTDFELPFPVTEASVRTSIIREVGDPGPREDQAMVNSELEYQKLVIEELKDHYAAKTSFAKNKELGIKISKWHEMISDKIKLSQSRGALNMNSLAGKIMAAFQSPVEGGVPTMPFKELVNKQSRRDIPRYFFACLQLTNEGNLDIFRSSPQPLTTDCVIIRQLRSTRTNYDLDETSLKSPTKDTNASPTQTSKKRNSLVRSPTVLDGKNLRKKVKQNIVRSYKRPKNFASVTSKRIKRSISTADSFLSD